MENTWDRDSEKGKRCILTGFQTEWMGLNSHVGWETLHHCWAPAWWLCIGRLMDSGIMGELNMLQWPQHGKRGKRRQAFSLTWHRPLALPSAWQTCVTRCRCCKPAEKQHWSAWRQINPARLLLQQEEGWRTSRPRPYNLTTTDTKDHIQ